MTQILVMVAQQARDNFAVSTALTLRSRMGRWFRLKIQQHSEQTGTAYFVDNESRIIKSVVSVLTRAAPKSRIRWQDWKHGTCASSRISTPSRRLSLLGCNPSATR